MKKGILLVLVTFPVLFVAAQSSLATDSAAIISLNQQIDSYVVQQNTTALDKLYAADFVFSHGSGRVEGKKGWLNSVTKGGFLLRQHDSVIVELHPGIAIVRGKLSVHKKNKEKTDRYQLKYIRVYAYRNDSWQMVSHFTMAEYHEPS
jgi:Domain of unknown function (DUF4440)